MNGESYKPSILLLEWKVVDKQGGRLEKITKLDLEIMLKSPSLI